MNSWVSYVKEYAKKNGMKYNEALKDPKCKAGYKKGGMLPVSHQQGHPVVVGSKKGFGVVDEAAAAGYADQPLIATLYNESQLGANAHKKYISL